MGWGLSRPIFQLILGEFFEEFWGAIKALIWLERPLRGYSTLVFLRKHWSPDGKIIIFFRLSMAGPIKPAIIRGYYKGLLRPIFRIL